MKKKYFINANIIDPYNSLNEIGGLIIGEDGKIEAVGKKVNIERSQEAIETGADEVAVACPFCYIMMDDGVKELGYGDNVRVRDVSLILLDNLKKD